MKKALVASAVVVAALFATGAAFAHMNGYGAGNGMGYGMGHGMGYGPGCYGNSSNQNVSVDTLKKFQKETLSLRDDLTSKQLDLQAEFDKASPDTARVDGLRKDIVDLQTKIGKVADKYGVPARGTMRGYGMGPGMMYGGAGTYGCAWR